LPDKCIDTVLPEAILQTKLDLTVNKYKQEKNKIEDNNKYSNLIDKVIDLLLNNYMYILISIVSVVIVIIIIIIIIYRRRDKIL
jgi:lipopolysaccharide/colanic/teichoic acid biosynthesis glycosyltransferase